MKPAALGIVFRDQRREVLLVQRCDIPVWVLPGGGIDAGESPEEAVIREVKEETGLDVIIKRQTALYQPANCFTESVYVFECDVVGGHLSQSAETRQALYTPLKNLPQHFFLYHREWLEDALQNEKIVQKYMSNRTFVSIVLQYSLRPWWALKYFMSRMKDR